VKQIVKVCVAPIKVSQTYRETDPLIRSWSLSPSSFLLGVTANANGKSVSQATPSVVDAVIQ